MIELEDGQELDRCYAETLEIRNFLDQTSVGAARVLRNARTRMAREAANVHFINDLTLGGKPQRRVAFPIIGGCVNHYVLHCHRGIVALKTSGVAAVVWRNNDAAPVWVEEQFGRVESQPARRIIRTVDAISVDLSRLQCWHEHVPIMVGAVGRGIEANHLRGTGVSHSVKKQQLNASCASAKQAEIHAAVDDCCT